jgi:predicted transcriptional regulator
MELVWTAGPEGAAIGELWDTIGARRPVLRTTVQNLVERLERRRWLRRRKIAGGYRYVATTTREQTARGLAEDFVDEFFAGSASELVMSLFGSTRLTREELARLRELVEARLARKNSQSRPR